MGDRIIELPKSRLHVAEGCLFKTTPKNEVVGKIRLSEIRAAKLEGRTQWAALATSMGFGAACAAAKLLIPSMVWSLVVAIPLGLIALVALAAMRTTQLSLDAAQGHLAFEVQEDRETAAAFLLTLKGLIAEEQVVRQLAE
jgi:hypothetical protein